MGTDLITIKSLLETKGSFSADAEWLEHVGREFDKLFRPTEIPSKDELIRTRQEEQVVDLLYRPQPLFMHIVD